MSRQVARPLVTISVPSFNQGRFLNDALASIFDQNLPVEVFVMDGGSTDQSINVIRKWEAQLSGWRSHGDDGQASAINEGIALGTAPYVFWLNSDDWLLPKGLSILLEAIKANHDAPAVYGRSWNVAQKTNKRTPTWVEPFDESRLALRCIVSQPATLIRRSAWEAVGGLNDQLHMAMDYDLWWRLFRRVGALHFVDEFVAVNREHKGTKTRRQRRLHYREAMAIVRENYGYVPLKWWLAQPYSIWLKALMQKLD